MFHFITLWQFFQVGFETSLFLYSNLSPLLTPIVSPFCSFLTCSCLPPGQEEVVTPPGGSRNNGDPTDCQIFTLTPPPTTRNPVTRIQPITRTPKCPFIFFPRRRPRVYIRFPNRPFLPPWCNRRFQFHPFIWPRVRLPPRYQYFPGRNVGRGSSSEESREKREAPNMLKPKRPMPRKRL